MAVSHHDITLPQQTSGSSNFTSSSSTDGYVAASSVGASPTRRLRVSSAMHAVGQDQSRVTPAEQSAAVAQCPPSQGVSEKDMDALKAACGEQLPQQML